MVVNWTMGMSKKIKFFPLSRQGEMMKKKTGVMKYGQNIAVKQCAITAIAQWIRLRLQSCHSGFEPQAHHLRCYSQICAIFVFAL